MKTHSEQLGDADNPDAHTSAVGSMFGRMASSYDLQNHVFSLGMDFWWRYHLVRSVTPEPGGEVLDLAAGTLDVSLDMCNRYPGIKVTAVDISPEMMEYGMRNKVRDAQRISTLVADVRNLPLAGSRYDAATIAFGIRNVIPRSEALAEIYRVLAPGGRICVLEFAPLTIPVLGRIYHWYMESVVPRLVGLFSDSAPAFTYFGKSIAQFPAPPAFCEELREAGFSSVRHSAFTLGIAHLYVGIKA